MRTKDELLDSLESAFEIAIQIAMVTEPTEEHFVTMFQIYSKSKPDLSEQEVIDFAGELHNHLHAQAQSVWMQEVYNQRIEVALLERKDFEEYYKGRFLLTTKWSDAIQEHLTSIGNSAQYIVDHMGEEVN
jgi:hypothetical protein